MKPTQCFDSSIEWLFSLWYLSMEQQILVSSNWLRQLSEQQPSTSARSRRSPGLEFIWWSSLFLYHPCALYCRLQTLGKTETIINSTFWNMKFNLNKAKTLKFKVWMKVFLAVCGICFARWQCNRRNFLYTNCIIQCTLYKCAFIL